MCVLVQITEKVEEIKFTRADLGKKFRVKTLREYGPYIAKDSLPIGTYYATVFSINSSGEVTWEIVGARPYFYTETSWIICGEDVEIIERVERLNV